MSNEQDNQPRIVRIDHDPRSSKTEREQAEQAIYAQHALRVHVAREEARREQESAKVREEHDKRDQERDEAPAGRDPGEQARSRMDHIRSEQDRGREQERER